MIIAIDPGGTTGIAIKMGETIETLTLPCDDVMQWLNDTTGTILPSDTVVIEYFKTAGMMSRYGLETIDLVGQVKGWCLAKNVPCITQSPMSRKSYIVLAEEMPGPRRVIHEIDALAHLLEYEAKRR